jgi:hypothetical protein
MTSRISRRDFIRAAGLAGIGAAVYSVDGFGSAIATESGGEPNAISMATGFSFVQISPARWPGPSHRSTPCRSSRTSSSLPAT